MLACYFMNQELLVNAGFNGNKDSEQRSMLRTLIG